MPDSSWILQSARESTCCFGKKTPDRGMRHGRPRQTRQNIYFSANCITLGSRELLIWPNTALFRAVLGFPGRKLFVTLYASARTSTFYVPRMRNIFDSAARSEEHTSELQSRQY